MLSGSLWEHLSARRRTFRFLRRRASPSSAASLLLQRTSRTVKENAGMVGERGDDPRKLQCTTKHTKKRQNDNELYNKSCLGDHRAVNFHQMFPILLLAKTSIVGERGRNPGILHAERNTKEQRQCINFLFLECHKKKVFYIINY